ncbi:hypothetical protein HZC31_07635 [Candidatus Woesearchaeota archaeon]|nr:hypothetical protein [Candidatus Woesearchaeota archaeon]
MKKKDERQLLEVLTLLKKVEPKDILKLLKEKEKQERQQQSQHIPVSLFAATPLSSLEAITVYLREKRQLQFVQMEKLLDRNQIALSTTYRRARKKYAISLDIPETKWTIPCLCIADKKLSVLESIVVYLKKTYSLSNASIAKLLKKDQRTIWTVLNRAKKKEVRT